MLKVEKMNKGEIKIYQTQDGTTSLEVKLENDTVWLSQSQMCTLFQKDKSVISRHIKNIFDEEELDFKSTVAKIATVQKEGARNIIRDIEFYNLDVVISVGYRVKSQRGTQFRIWANRILKDFLVQGYALNKSLLEKRTEQLTEIKNALKLIENPEFKKLSVDETKGLLEIISNYGYALEILDKYDYQFN